MSKNRMTHQKLRILEYLRSVRSHPTAEEVYEHLKKEMPTISLATVYRNLNLLSKDGNALKLEIKGSYHFDGDLCHHQHCVCKKCGRIVDIFEKEICAYAMRKVPKKIFTPTGVTVIFTGICSTCRQS